MKKLFLILLLFSLACSSSGKLTGKVYVAGNEPFTWVALEAPNGTIYKIVATKELEQKLRSLQWRKVEVEYTKISDAPEGKVLTVNVVKEINP